MPWQQYAADIAYELDDDGSLFYDEVDLLVGRQSGKTRWVFVRKTHRLTAMVRTHGPQRSMYMAQSRLKARQRLERVFGEGLRGSRAFKEITHPRTRPQRPTEWKLNLNNGSEQIQFGRSSYLQIDAPSRTGGHGDTLDDADIDEAFAHEDDTVELGIRPTQATRRDAQLYVISAAGDERSRYLYRKLLSGRAAVESGDSGQVAYLEWSADEDADPGDPKTWWACCPALGFTIDESFMAAEWARAQRKGLEGVDTFRRSYLNQWPRVPLLDDDLGAPRLIPVDDWVACGDPACQAAGGLAWTLDVSPLGESAAIGVSDGVYGEVIDHRTGTGWVVGRLRDLKARWGFSTVALDASGPAGSLLTELEPVVDVRKVTLAEHAQACGSLLDAVKEHRFRHRCQVPLDAAVAGAGRRQVTDVWLWSRTRSTVDIAPLVAVTLARWIASQRDGDILF